MTNDGAAPKAALIQGLDGVFYGTTSSGGSAGLGTVFSITLQGHVTILHSFGDGTVPSDGSAPVAPLLQGSDGNFYGTTPSGGTAGKGTIFKISSAGVMSIVHQFGDGFVANDGATRWPD